MTRRALVAALLAGLAGTSLSARDSQKVTYTCGTVPGTIKRADGRLNTWNLSAFTFTPDKRGTRPMLIRYSAITRLEYGHTPPHPAERADAAPITLPCALNPERKNYYLTIKWKVQTDQKTRERQERHDRLARWDSKELADPEHERNQKDEKGEKKEMEYFAVFELGDGVLRPALRILETRSGKRVNYQDAHARKAAR